MLAVHSDNILFLLLAGIALLMRLLAKKAGSTNKRPEDPAPSSSSSPPPIRRVPDQSGKEQIRKFLEALGQPPTAEPPPKVAPRESTPSLTEFQRRQIDVAAREARRRNLANPLPPLTTVPPPATPRRVTLPRQMTETPPELKTPKAAAARARLDVQEGRVPTEPPAVQTAAEAYALSTEKLPSAAGAKTDLATLLSSPAGLRNAMILREIFGPPRGLQAFDLVGSA